jgi:hypothetical protein
LFPTDIQGLEPVRYGGVLLNAPLHASLTLHSLLNVPVQFANKMKLEKFIAKTYTKKAHSCTFNIVMFLVTSYRTFTVHCNMCQVFSMSLLAVTWKLIPEMSSSADCYAANTLLQLNFPLPTLHGRNPWPLTDL